MSGRTVSVIVPVYRAADYLSDLVARLAAQTDGDYELLFVDDCSPDGSRDVIRRLAERDDRIRYYEHGENRGQGAARNTGLDHASGEYVMYIDADDSFAPNYLERMKAAIEKDEADIAICNSVWVYADRCEEHNMFLARPWTRYRLLSGDEAIRRYFQVYESDMWIPVEPWGKIVRRSFIEKHKIRHKEALFEDVVMTFNELALVERLACIRDHLYFYNKTNGNAATIQDQKRYVREIYRAPEGVFEVLQKHSLREETRRYATLFYFRYIDGAYSFFARGQRFEEELRYMLERYRDLPVEPNFGDMQAYVVRHLKGFYLEMKKNRLSHMFTYFLAPHREYLDSIIMEALPIGRGVAPRGVFRAIYGLCHASKTAVNRCASQILRFSSGIVWVGIGATSTATAASAFASGLFV